MAAKPQFVSDDEHLSRLATLRSLSATLAGIETHRRAQPTNGPADQEAAGKALVAVITALRRLGMETAPLARLNASLHNVAVYGRHDAILSGPKRHSRAPDALGVQMAKAALAGVMAVRMQCGDPRDRASAWIARTIPADLSRKLSPNRPIKPGTVADWYDLFSGRHGEKNDAAARFYTVLEISAGMIRTGAPDDQCLRRIISGLSSAISGKAGS